LEFRRVLFRSHAVASIGRLISLQVLSDSLEEDFRTLPQPLLELSPPAHQNLFLCERYETAIFQAPYFSLPPALLLRLSPPARIPTVRKDLGGLFAPHRSCPNFLWVRNPTDASPRILAMRWPLRARCPAQEGRRISHGCRYRSFLVPPPWPLPPQPQKRVRNLLNPSAPHTV